MDSTMTTSHRPKKTVYMEMGVKRNPEHYLLSKEQKAAIAAALPAWARDAAKAAKELGVETNVTVRMQTEEGEIFEAQKSLDLRSLIQSHESFGHTALAKLANSYYFERFLEWRRRSNPVWGRNKDNTPSGIRFDEKTLERYKKEAAITRPDVGRAKREGCAWALALEYPEVRAARTADVMREAPVTFMRLVLKDLEEAALELRLANKVKHTDDVGWMRGFKSTDTTEIVDGVEVPVFELTRTEAQLSELYIVSSAARKRLDKAVDHCKLYHMMLREWVEENGRQLKVHAVVYNLYMNPYQISVPAYLELVDQGKLLTAAVQFNRAHQINMRKVAKRAWAKLRFWCLVHFPNRVGRIASYWQEMGIRRACRPADAETGWEGGRLWLQDMAELDVLLNNIQTRQEELEELLPPPDCVAKVDADVASRAEKKRKRDERLASGGSSSKAKSVKYVQTTLASMPTSYPYIDESDDEESEDHEMEDGDEEVAMEAPEA